MVFIVLSPIQWINHAQNHKISLHRTHPPHNLNYVRGNRFQYIQFILKKSLFFLFKHYFLLLCVFCNLHLKSPLETETSSRKKEAPKNGINFFFEEKSIVIIILCHLSERFQLYNRMNIMESFS